jgi:TonB-dependent receptor
MMSKVIITVAMLLLSVSLFAQKQTITGKVLNNKNEGVLAKVELTGANVNVLTSTEGRFVFNNIEITATSTLVITAKGYETKILNELNLLNKNEEILITLEAIKPKQEKEIIVKATSARRETITAMITYQKNTNTIAQVVSSQQIRMSPDKNGGEIIKRTPGASLQDGKYIVVRGLADRYNQVTINGALMNSTEPDRKSFSFDILPASIIENIIINKAALPEMPAEFAGSLIQIKTKDIAEKNFTNIQLSTGFNTQTINEPFYSYKGGSLDFLGLDDGGRKLPTSFPLEYSVKSELSNGQKAELAQKLNTNWNYSANGTAPLNTGFQISNGFSKSIGENKKIGVTSALLYNQQYRFTPATRNFYEGGDIKRFEFVDNIYNRSMTSGALINLVYSAPKTKLSSKTSYNISGADQTVLRNGEENSNSLNIPLKSNLLSFKSNRLFTSQLIGEHTIRKNLKFKWGNSFNRLMQDIPDLKNLVYRAPNNPNNYFADVPNVNGNARNAGRFFSTLDDIVITSNADLAYSYKIGEYNQALKIGGMYQYKDRYFTSRVFGIVSAQPNLPELALSPKDIFELANFNATKFYFDEVTSASNAYKAIGNLQAAYIQSENQWNKKLKLVYGVRVENFNQTISFPKINLKNKTIITDVLPSLNATYVVNTKTNLRFSASQTVARPEFREVSIFSFYDFEKNAIVNGNPDLKRSRVTNLDLRYELYPKAGEIFTIALFYKHFNTPIESNTAFNAGTITFSYLNANSAQNIGIELDVRKKLDFINSSFTKNLVAFLNTSVINSSVNLDGLAGEIANRPMQGQSNYVINGGLQYEHNKSGTVANVLVNRIGRRIAFVGNTTFEPIWENPRTLLDLQFTKKILKNKAEIKITANDLLNQNLTFYQDRNDNKRFNSGTDKVFNQFKQGTNFGLAITFSL